VGIEARVSLDFLPVLVSACGGLAYSFHYADRFAVREYPAFPGDQQRCFLLRASPSWSVSAKADVD
jgi:hypothetical protein